MGLGQLHLGCFGASLVQQHHCMLAVSWRLTEQQHQRNVYFADQYIMTCSQLLVDGEFPLATNVQRFVQLSSGQQDVGDLPIVKATERMSLSFL